MSKYVGVSEYPSARGVVGVDILWAKGVERSCVAKGIKGVWGSWGRVGLGLGVGRTDTGDGDRGCFWHSVQPRRKRVTASLGKKAYVSVI